MMHCSCSFYLVIHMHSICITLCMLWPGARLTLTLHLEWYHIKWLKPISHYLATLVFHTKDSTHNHDHLFLMAIFGE